MSIAIQEIDFSKKVKDPYIKTVSFSVDCDTLNHYLNFTSPDTKVKENQYMYSVMVQDLLNLFGRYNIKATFFCIADQLKQKNIYGIFKKIISAGHAIGNHTLDHPDAADLSGSEYVQNIYKGREMIKELLGIQPLGYRAPACYITEDALNELARLRYFYDSSVCYSKITNILIKILRMTNKNYRPKKQAKLHSRFPGQGPYLIKFDNGSRLLEWPIPKSLGLAYYGTFHCSAPRYLFVVQTFILGFSRRHLHYEIHPIELMSRACLAEFPWLSSLPFAHKKDLLVWMDRRLNKLTSKRKITTLEELSNAYLHILYH